MRIGLDYYTIAHRRLAAGEALGFARARGLDGVQFLEPAALAADLDAGALAALARHAEALGLYLEVGLPSPNPLRRTRQEGRAVTAVEHARELRRHVEAVAALGCRHARAYVGDRHDRFRADATWAAQRAATREVLLRLAPCCRDLGVRVALETHADLTAAELLELLEALDPGSAGVTLDTGNLVMRLDDPVGAAERLAPWVLATHVKDMVLAYTPRGLCWQARPVGSGILPIPELLAPVLRANPGVNLSIELHQRTYDLPIFDPSWLAYFPGLRPADLAAVARLACLCERRYADGSLERPEAVEAIPWAERDLEWLARSAGYLRAAIDRSA
ncbi:MAG TPA: sugar phosphate isomerase/epimerase [Isosphaeraceae bacterium]|jgi:sugar phosphate isomerase/epimerase